MEIPFLNIFLYLSKSNSCDIFNLLTSHDLDNPTYVKPSQNSISPKFKEYYNIDKDWDLWIVIAKASIIGIIVLLPTKFFILNSLDIAGIGNTLGLSLYKIGPLYWSNSISKAYGN